MVFYNFAHILVRQSTFIPRESDVLTVCRSGDSVELRQGWDLVTGGERLEVWHEKYSFPAAVLGIRPSHLWHSLKRIRARVQAISMGERRRDRLGRGLLLKIWDDDAEQTAFPPPDREVVLNGTGAPPRPVEPVPELPPSEHHSWSLWCFGRLVVGGGHDKYGYSASAEIRNPDRMGKDPVSTALLEFFSLYLGRQPSGRWMFARKRARELEELFKIWDHLTDVNVHDNYQLPKPIRCCGVDPSTLMRCDQQTRDTSGLCEQHEIAPTVFDVPVVLE